MMHGTRGSTCDNALDARAMHFVQVANGIVQVANGIQLTSKAGARLIDAHYVSNAVE